MNRATRRWIVGHQWLGVNVWTKYVSLRGPANRPVFSERNRIKCHVLPLGFGWRLVIRPRIAL